MKKFLICLAVLICAFLVLTIVICLWPSSLPSDTPISAENPQPEPISPVIEEPPPSEEPEQESAQEEPTQSAQFSPLFYIYRTMLDSNQQQAYDQLYTSASNLDTAVSLTVPLSIDALEETMTALYYDHPSLFWLDSSYSYTYNQQQMVQQVTLEFNETANYITKAQNQFDTALKEMLAGARQYNTAFEQELYVHNYLLQNSEYVENSLLDQSAYSALVLGKSVCAGYSRAFQLAMQQLGIPCYYCAGYAKEDHAWNIVKLGDGYYNVDVAWDDPVGNTSGELFYDYFNLSDRKIGADHKRTDLSVNLPACDKEDLSYFAVYGQNAQGLRPDVYNLEELGYSPQQAIATLEEYYRQSQSLLLQSGTGEHSYTLILEEKSLYDRIARALDTKELFAEITAPVAQTMELRGYSAEIQLQGRPTRDGYIILTQTINLSPNEPPIDNGENHGVY